MVPSSGGHGRKVGVCTSIRNSPNVVVVGHDTLVEGCAIYVTIKWYQCIINIINMYAPNSSTKWALFWRRLAVLNTGGNGRIHIVLLDTLSLGYFYK